jgi:hypothetical protein
MPRKTIKDLDIGLEAQKWKIEFGGIFGEKIRSCAGLYVFDRGYCSARNALYRTLAR